MECTIEITMTKEVGILSDLHSVSLADILQAFVDKTVAEAMEEMAE
ncbi:hypothetical protein SAMN05421788_11174 [Filimonas lacunae]|uniref:Uncharacterized protein n=1 Tax=Filimonas lacunae TaxID=477680 RepID=A0A173MAZ8_9BACT|nr:hypothetical protein [Filimonas lacunae]BAV04725.1 hypothetical protein FLA_0724 [Filimonas lacunae]SIT32275.1 hypothetical protein SAMN05421788_11174 [Filimonas lacunae]